MNTDSVQLRSRHSLPAALEADTFRRFQELLRERVGIFLSASKAQLLISRLSKRLRERDCPDLDAYYELVTTAPDHEDEFQRMVNRITTNKTDFFREPHHFTVLAAQLRTLARERPNKSIRIWSAGCSTGEEPYSIALTLEDALPRGALSDASILATDIDTDVLEFASAGVYANARLAPIAEERWQRSFLRGTGRWAGTVKVGKTLRERVTFAPRNLIETDWVDEGAFDVIFCRNTLIYFDRPTQRAIVRRLAACLQPGGLLMLGHSENLLGDEPGLEPGGATTFRRVMSPSSLESYAPPARPLTARVTSGGMYCSARPAIVRTLLGSCVSACLFDPETGVGGMNHFLLPSGVDRSGGRALAYGVHAMEVLINEIMRRGGDRRRLRAKVFGGASVLRDFQGGRDVARRNAAFVRRFLADEEIPILAEKLGGTHPIEVRFETHTGRAFARTAGRSRQAVTAEADVAYIRKLAQDAQASVADAASAITIFGDDHD
jgi:chemotaxis protein methyltransferase CheR